MQTDAGFIENVENACQTGADLRREPYPLRFAAGKRAALAVQCEIAEPDFYEKLQARANLADNVCYDVLLLLGQVDTGDKSQRVFDGLLAELMDVQFAALPARCSLGGAGSGLDCDGKDFRFESCAAADLACLACHECSNAIARKLALGLLIEPLQLGHESLERFCDFLFAVAAKLYFNRLAVCAEVKRGFECFRQIGERCIFADVEVFDQRILQMPIVDSHAFCAATPWCDCSFCQRFGLVGDHQVRIDHQLCSQTVTSRASAKVAVERKMSRR